MKMIKLFTAALLCSVTFSVSAQNLDDVLNNYINVLGGKEKLDSLQSVKMTGKLEAQGYEIPLTITCVHDKGYRFDMEIMGTENYQLADTTEGWIYMPVQQMKEPEKMEEGQYRSLQTNFNLHGGTFVNYKKNKDIRVEVDGSDLVNGEPVHKLKVTDKAGDINYYFIDMKSGRLVKTMKKVWFNGQSLYAESTYSDFRKTADGFWFPYSIQTSNGTIIFDKIETNVAVPYSLFQKP
ncbi:MAG: hypothetical protein JST03_03635 [Bacteroidetes bacterium]|nr:hypothetical protein [Bacteroidota bacterium]